MGWVGAGPEFDHFALDGIVLVFGESQLVAKTGGMLLAKPIIGCGLLAYGLRTSPFLLVL